MSEIYEDAKGQRAAACDWVETTVGAECSIVSGKSKAQVLDANGKYIVVDMGGVDTTGGLIAKKRTSLPDDLLYKGDIVMPKDDIGGGQIIGKAAYIPEDGKYVLGDHVFLLRAANVDPMFLSHMLNSHEINKLLKRKVVGSAQLGLSKVAVREQTFRMPPLEEQRRIAAALSAADEVVQGYQALIAKKELVKSALMSELLSGERRLPGFDGEWKRINLGDCTISLKSVQHSRDKLSQIGELGYIHYGDIHTGKSIRVFDTSLPRIGKDMQSTASLLQPGDIVFADASEDLAGVAKAVELKTLTLQGVVSGLHTIAIRPNHAVIRPGFGGYIQYLPSFRQHISKMASGTKVLAIGKKHIASAPVYIPPLLEQQAIFLVLEAADTELDSLKMSLDKSILVRDALQSDLLSGRRRL